MPIFYAARLKRLKALRLLIQAGAHPSIVDNLKTRSWEEVRPALTNMVEAARQARGADARVPRIASEIC
jgi:hypothetical protein